jgi:recombination DNA repair RAD52 pathway protein
MEKFKEAIYRRFPEEQIKQRPGKGGRTLDYIPTPFIIDRLNEVFAFNWSFQVFNVEILDTEVYVTGKLTGPVNGKIESKEQFGCKDRIKGNSLGDTLKSAASDALKKCATLFGIASHLYKKDSRAIERFIEAPQITPNVNLQDKPPNHPTKALEANKRSGNRVITEPQRKRMFAISGGQKDVIDFVVAKHGFESSKEVTMGAAYDAICEELDAIKTSEGEKKQEELSYTEYIPTADPDFEEFGEEPPF